MRPNCIARWHNFIHDIVEFRGLAQSRGVARVEEMRARAPLEMAQGTSQGVACVDEVREEAPLYVAQGMSRESPSEVAKGMSQAAA